MVRSKNIILFNRVIVTESASGCEVVTFICALEIERRSILVILENEILGGFVVMKFGVSSVMEFANFVWKEVRVGIIEI